MKFIGREQELAKLAEQINKDELNVSLIYGRRRIGKSELVKQAIKNTDALVFYYECKEVAEANNAQSLSSMISENLDLPPLAFTKIEDVIAYVFEMSKKRKVVLVLDEYPYLKESVKGIDSILQTLIDNNKDESKLSLILLGSFVEVMKSMLEHSNPLYGRISLTINLKQMDYYDSSLFYKDFSNEDKVRLYSVFGGVPYYNSLIDSKKTVKENIIDLIAGPYSKLENEVSMYLKSEISKITNANEVFEALAQGYSKYSDLLSQSHVSSGPTLVDVLDKLIKMEVVTKVNPINGITNKKKSSYCICDNLTLFYYRYVFKYSSQLRIMDADAFFDKYIDEDFNKYYVPHLFESVCSQYLIRRNKLGLMDPIIEKIGKYYYDDSKNHLNGEFDIVTMDEKGYAFYEVKFRDKPITSDIINKEINQVRLTGLNCYKYVFISKSGFDSDKPSNVEFISLDSLYS